MDRSDQMLSYYLFERKVIKWWKKLSFRLFDLVVVIAHILHAKTSKNKILLEICYEKVTEGLLASAGIEILCQNCSPDGRLKGSDHFVYRIPATHAVMEGRSQCSCHVCAGRNKCQTGKTVKQCTTVYC